MSATRRGTHSVKILVTGAAGLIGAACRRTLNARGYQLLAPSSTELNLLEEARVRAYLEQHRPTHLLHAAWRAVSGDVLDSPANLAWLRASLFLVKAFHEAGGARAACVGSSAEYDWSLGVCRIGTTPRKPSTAYGAAKHALRVAAVGHAHAVGLSFVWPRVFDVYGPGEHSSRLSAFVLRCLLEGRPAELTNGRQIRDYLYVEDVAEGIVAALLSAYSGETDIVAGKPVTVRELAIAIARQVGREDLLRFGAKQSPSDEVPVILGDAAHARDSIGWESRYDLQMGVAALVEWGREAFRK